MGMFDTVWVDCPYCNRRTDLQSKSGNCMLDEYELNEAPMAVMWGLLEGGGWRLCGHCKKKINVVIDRNPEFKVEKEEFEDEDEEA